MIEINDKLDQKFRLQMDGVHEHDEERRLCQIAQSYSICENSIAVLSNLRTNKSMIFFGRSCELLGMGKTDTSQAVDSVWEEEILDRIHPDDWRKRNLQELAFYRMVSSSHTKETFAWYLENSMRMRDNGGKYRLWRHRIFYFVGNGRQGVSYALCLYNPTTDTSEGAYIVNTMTGERRILAIDESNLLTEREKIVLQMIRDGMSSKAIADRLGISKHTIDRHRQNIIGKLQVNNTTEACHKANRLGLID